MATKKLGRSIIECGRGKYNQFERREVARLNRRLKLDEEGEPLPRAIHSFRELRDSLNALKRWLQSHVGQSWDRVYSEFCSKEDKRSLRGDHIHRHLKDMVRGSGGREAYYRYTNEDGFSGWGFKIDEQGILRHKPYRRSYYPKYYLEEQKAKKWLAGRLVTWEDGAYFWVKTKIEYPSGDAPKWKLPIVRSYKTAGRMSNEDVKIWLGFSQRTREKLVDSYEMENPRR